MTRVRIKLFIDTFFEDTNDENNMIRIDTIKCYTWNKSNSYNKGFSGNKFEAYIFEILKENNTIKNSTFIYKKDIENNILEISLEYYIIPLTLKLSFELFDLNDEEVLNDLRRVSHFYDNFVVLEYKEYFQKILNHLMTQ